MAKLVTIVAAVVLSVAVALPLSSGAVYAQADTVQAEQTGGERKSDNEWKYVPVRRYATEEGDEEGGDAGFDGRLLTAEDLVSE